MPGGKINIFGDEQFLAAAKLNFVFLCLVVAK